MITCWKLYYHLIDRGVDFITLDNSSPDEFDLAQTSWPTGDLQRAPDNPAVRTIVLGMHAALPDSFSAGHSMDDSAQEEFTGRKLYASLWVSQEDRNYATVYKGAPRVLVQRAPSNCVAQTRSPRRR